jgi:hypothetical protein
MSESPWSIAVKTVGGSGRQSDSERQIISDFTLTVSPDDELKSLHQEIENITGLKASQQRLIYRGRLISNGTGDMEEEGNQDDSHSKKKPRIRDVVGLSDGQTIHLVPRIGSTEGTESTTAPDEDNQEDDTAEPAEASSDDRATVSSLVGASLLAALLGLSDDDDDDEDEDERRNRRRRSARYSRYRRGRHRLTSEDLVVPDPGSLEPVRQGIMTLHTMLDARPAAPDFPQDTSRHFYRGQWIDCRDTVNQWLEATIVDIVGPREILGDRMRPRHTQSRRRRSRYPAVDPIIPADDLEGRRRLLVEPDSEYGERERDTNHDVQLLLIHYNGWAHRWNEWIRSDSERIRPFRTRTRHAGDTALPTTDSPFEHAPSTSIRDDSDEIDREALLPELARVVSAFNVLLDRAVANANPPSNETPRVLSGPRDLPWSAAPDTEGEEETEENSHLDGNSPARLPVSRRELERLAPLTDRLGRTLTEAAPHIASLAASMPEEKPDTSAQSETQNISSLDESEASVPRIEDTSAASALAPATGFFSSLLSRRSSSRSARVEDIIPEEEAVGEILEDPDFVDFVNGMTNTSRGDVSSRQSSDGGTASLLGAYLAAASLSSLANGNDDGSGNDEHRPSGLAGLGRLLRHGNSNNNNGDGGIDIHIHAIVTGPGIGPAALAMGQPQANTITRANGTGRPPSRTRRSSRNRNTSIPSSTDDLSDGIFDALYSENPTPLDPHGESQITNESVPNGLRQENTGTSELAPLSSLTTDLPTVGSRVSSARSANRRRRGSVLSRLLRRVLSRR